MAEGLQQAAPRPGWYEDPEAPDLLRWWDGVQWSDHDFRPKPLGDDRQNRRAGQARVLFFWALAVALPFWLVPTALTFVPSPEIQTVGIILVWIGFLPVLTLSVLAIVFGGIGLSRARRDGQGRGSALTGLIGGISVIAAPGILTAVGVAVLFALAPK